MSIMDDLNAIDEILAESQVFDGKVALTAQWAADGGAVTPDRIRESVSQYSAAHPGVPAAVTQRIESDLLASYLELVEIKPPAA